MAAEPATDLSGRLLLMEAVLSSEDDALVDACWRTWPGWRARTARGSATAGRPIWPRAPTAATEVGWPEAQTLLDDLARRRPDWSRVALLQGRLAELDGDAAAALDAYQRAFDLGERRPDVAQPLTRMLTARGRWDDADRVFRTLQEQMVLRGGLARQAAEVALQTHNGGRAVELARLAAPTDDTYTYHIWMGQFVDGGGPPFGGRGRAASGGGSSRTPAGTPRRRWRHTLRGGAAAGRRRPPSRS